MQLIKVHTRTLLPPKDDLYDVMEKSLPPLVEGDVVLITSKVVSIHEGRCLRVADVSDKDGLILEEAEQYIPREESPQKLALLTIKRNTLIPSAGIDVSNASEHYILWPEDPTRSAQEIRSHLLDRYEIKNLGVIITDSHTLPLRYGVVGISIGFAGLRPLKDYRGTNDIFGRELIMTQSNIVDALSAIGVLLMGEGNEQTPIIVIRGFDDVEFVDKDTSEDLRVPPEVDLYTPVLKTFRKK